MSDTAEILVQTKGLKHSYPEGRGRKQVLHGIDLAIQPGSNVFLTGYSGSGKTTLISLIGCLRSVQEGSLMLLGEELHKASEKKLRHMRRRIGYVFQHFNLLDFMTIRQNVQQSLELRTDFSPRQAKKRSEEMLDLVGLGDRVKAYPNELSGGQKQRVAIARALVHRPRLVLADEPTAALDIATGRDIIRLVQALSKQQNSAAIIVTHNMRILDTADEILHMVDGRLGTAVTEQISLVFPTLSDDQLTTVVSASEVRSFRQGDRLIEQGEKGGEFFILLSGAVNVIRQDDGQPDPQTLRLSTRGTYFGEISLIQRGKAMASVECADNGTRAIVIGEDAFLAMLEASPLTQDLLAQRAFERLTADDLRDSI